MEKDGIPGRGNSIIKSREAYLRSGLPPCKNKRIVRRLKR